MADSRVSISFGADASDFLEGVGRVSAALQALPTGVNQVAQGINRSAQSFSAFGAGATGALKKVAQAARETGASQEQATRASVGAIHGEIFAERATFAERQSLYAELARLRILSGQQRLAATRSALDAEYSAEKSLLEKELRLGGLRLAQRRRVLNRMLALDIEYARDSQRIILQSVQQTVAPINKMVDAISASLSSGWTGMILGTRNFHQVMQSLTRTLVSQFVRMGVEMVANWAKAQIAQVVLSQTAEGQKTAAALAGAAARTGVAGAEAAASLGPQIAAAVRSIVIDAGATFAGVFAFLAPFMGPAAAGPAAASQGAVLAAASFDIGAWSIPQDQLALVHRNELVMPAAEAGAFRSMLSGAAQGHGGAGPGAGGGVQVHLNVSALDAGSVKNWLSNNSRQIAKAMNQAIKDGDHLGLRRLAGV